MMSKVLIISHSSVLSVNRKAYELLAKRGIEVVLIAPEKWPSGGLGNEYSFEPLTDTGLLKVYTCRPFFRGNGSLYFYSIIFFRIIKNESPDFIFLDEEPWSLIALQTICALKLVPQKKRPKLFIYTKQNIAKNYPVPFSLIEKWAHRSILGAFVVSRECADVLTTKGFKKEVMILPHGVDLELFRPLPNKNSPFITIGFVGRMVEAKGGLDLIEAFSIAIKEIPNLRLKFIGGGPDEDKWKNKVNTLKLSELVDFCGPSNHNVIGKEIAQLDILAVPSRTTPTWKEQFGRILVESAACGVPVIASNSGAIPMVLESLGCGIIYNEKSIKDFSSCIIQLAKNKEERIKYARAGFDNAKEKYCFDTIADKMEHFFKCNEL